MIRPLVTTVDEPRPVVPALAIFAAVQLALLAAIPVLAWVGARAVLDSRAGRFVDEPAPGEPGWIAFVDPTPAALGVIVDGSTVAGAVYAVALGDGRTGGTLFTLPPSYEVGDGVLGDLSPVEAGPALVAELGWAVGELELLDATTLTDALGGGTVTVDNPDPVLDAEGTLAFAVGPVELGGADIGPYLAGRLADGAPGDERFRHDLFWTALAGRGWTASDTLGTVMAAVLDAADGSTGAVVRPLAEDPTARTAEWRASVIALEPLPGDPLVDVHLPAGGASIDEVLATFTAAGVAVSRVEVDERPVGDGLEILVAATAPEDVTAFASALLGPLGADTVGRAPADVVGDGTVRVRVAVAGSTGG